MNVPTAPQLGVRFLLGVVLLAVGPTLFWDLLVQAQAIAPPLDPAAHVETSMLVFAIACACVIAFAWWQQPGLPWRPLRARLVVASYVPFALLWAGVLVGYLVLARRLGLAVPPQQALEYLAAGPVDRPGFWIVVAATSLGAPVAEEIVFRGYLQQALAGMFRPWLAVLLAAAVFGAVHTLPYALPVGLLGAFFGLLVVRSGSLWPAVFCHALHNALTVAITVLWPQSLTLLYPR